MRVGGAVDRIGHFWGKQTISTRVYSILGAFILSRTVPYFFPARTVSRLTLQFAPLTSLIAMETAAFKVTASAPAAPPRRLVWPQEREEPEEIDPTLIPRELLSWIYPGHDYFYGLAYEEYLRGEAPFFSALDYAKEHLLETPLSSLSARDWRDHLSELFTRFDKAPPMLDYQALSTTVSQSSEPLERAAKILLTVKHDQVGGILANLALIQGQQAPFSLEREDRLAEYRAALSTNDEGAFLIFLRKHQQDATAVRRLRKTPFESYETVRRVGIDESFFASFPEYLSWCLHPGGSGERVKELEVMAYRGAEIHALEALRDVRALNPQEIEDGIRALATKINGALEPLTYRDQWIMVVDPDSELASVAHNREALREFYLQLADRDNESFSTRDVTSLFEKFESHEGFEAAAPYLSSEEWRVLRSSAFIPAAPQDVPRLMAEFSQELSGLRGDAITVAAWAHQRLTEIHPFNDGTGRTARLVMNTILLRERRAPVAFANDAYYMRIVKSDGDGFEQGLRTCVELAEHRLERGLTPVRHNPMSHVCSLQ